METVRHEFQQRQHMLLEDFEVYHYCDSRELHVSLHFHDFYECLLLVSGRLSYRIDDATFDMRAGDLLLIRPNQLHRPVQSDASVPYERIVLWLARPFLERLSTEKTDLARCFTASAHGVYRFPKLLRSEVESKLLRVVEAASSDRFGQDVLCNAEIIRLLVLLNRSCPEPRHILSEAERDESRLAARVSDYLDRHLSEDVRLDDIAGAVYLSKYHLTRRFKKETGTTIHQMLLQKRMIHARDRILEGAPLAEVAAACGFSEYSGFYKAFRTEYGLAPAAYAARAAER